MAEFEETLYAFPDRVNGIVVGHLRLVAVCESTQTQPDSEGSPTPLVVRIRVVNTATRKGLGRWQQSNGTVVTREVVPGENAENNVAPNRRVGVANMVWSMSALPVGL